MPFTKIKKFNPRPKKVLHLNPFFIIALSFLGVIFLGSFLLSMPFSIKEGVTSNYIDNLFTATTSLCVTGLVSAPLGVGGTYTFAGQIIVLILIQIGGLGVTTFGSIFFLFIQRKVDMNQQKLIKENWNLSSYKGIKPMFYKILCVSFSFEIFGSILSFIDFYYIHNFELTEAIKVGVFNSVSAFNNAGIDILGTSSLINYNSDVLLLLTNSFLIIMGGIGYFVVIDIIEKRFHFKKLTLHSKVVITYTIFLIIAGTLLIYVSEINNNSNMTFLNSYFMSVSSRTAGFTTNDLYLLRNSTIIILCLFMFIGASPGSAGGGIKTTTIAVFFAFFRSNMTSRSPHLFKRDIKKDLINKALLIIIMGVGVFLSGYFIINCIEGAHIYVLNNQRIDNYVEGCRMFQSIDYAFEAMSGFATVGLTTGITPYLHVGSKVVLVALMYIGRVGPLTLSVMFKPKEKAMYRYVSEDVSIG